MSLSSRNSEVLTFENRKLDHGSIQELFGEKKTLLLGCDWPADIPSSKLTANERRGLKRKHSGDMKATVWRQRKCGGIGPIIVFDFVFNH